MTTSQSSNSSDDFVAKTGEKRPKVNLRNFVGESKPVASIRDKLAERKSQISLEPENAEV